jgi:hypothetical protein
LTCCSSVRNPGSRASPVPSCQDLTPSWVAQGSRGEPWRGWRDSRTCRWSPTSCQRVSDCILPRTNATSGCAILELRPRQRRVDGVRIYLPHLWRRGSSCAPTVCRSIIQSRPAPLSVRIAGVQLDRKSASQGDQFHTVRLFVPWSRDCFHRCRCCLRGTCSVHSRGAYARSVHHHTAPRDGRNASLACDHRTPLVALLGAGQLSS